jgi:hypothetical protein
LSSSFTIHEGLQQGFAVDRDKRLVSNVCLLGETSLNGYTYSSEARQQACPLYLNRPVYLDHSKNPTERSIRELAGRVVSPRMQEGKPYGDIKVARGSAGDTFLSLAEDQAEDPNWVGVGMSHVISGRKSKNGKIVEAVDKVLSVDLVAGPATTTNMRESEDTSVLDKLKPILEGKKPAVERLKAIYEACEVEFVEADQEVPVSLTVESVADLEKIDSAEIKKLLKEHRDYQHKQWAREVIAECKLEATDKQVDALAKLADKSVMKEQATLIKEAVDEAKKNIKPEQKGREPSKDAAKLDYKTFAESIKG